MAVAYPGQVYRSYLRRHRVHVVSSRGFPRCTGQGKLASLPRKHDARKQHDTHEEEGEVKILTGGHSV